MHFFGLNQHRCAGCILGEIGGIVFVIIGFNALCGSSYAICHLTGAKFNSLGRKVNCIGAYVPWNIGINNGVKIVNNNTALAKRGNNYFVKSFI